MSINITLNQLISELSDIEETKKPIQQKYENSSLPEYFKNILGDKIYRQGIVQKFQSSTRTLNISLYYSILYLLDDDFNNMDEFKQVDSINILINKMCSDINSNALITKYNYKEIKIKKKDLLSEISNYKNTNKVIKFLSDYFDINIFICNLEFNKLYCACDNNYYNKYRNNIVICKINPNSFEPLMTKKNKILSYDNHIMKNLLDNHKDDILPIYGCDFIIRSDFDIDNDLADENNIDEKNDENFDEQVDEKNDENFDEQVDEKNDENVDEYKDKKPKYSLKSRLNDLQKIAKLYNINLKKKIDGREKNKTKSEIILDLDLHFSNN
jgi:predicted house-cleaning noncanonical NTP pyrophosphatase (MazG superfamily)